VAVIGPLGDATRVLRGNYSSPNSAPPVSVVEGCAAPCPVLRSRWCPSPPRSPMAIRCLRAFPDARGKPGLRADYFNALDPAKPRGERTMAPRPPSPAPRTVWPSCAGDQALSDAYKVVWSGFFVAPETGFYRMGVRA
jgi:beta-glucosidase